MPDVVLGLSPPVVGGGVIWFTTAPVVASKTRTNGRVSALKCCVLRQ
jgi:hypothetical protein